MCGVGGWGGAVNVDFIPGNRPFMLLTQRYQRSLSVERDRLALEHCVRHLAIVQIIQREGNAGHHMMLQDLQGGERGRGTLAQDLQGVGRME